jgi:hypothetical protein
VAAGIAPVERAADSELAWKVCVSRLKKNAASCAEMAKHVRSGVWDPGKAR